MPRSLGPPFFPSFALKNNPARPRGHPIALVYLDEIRIRLEVFQIIAKTLNL